MRSSSGAHFIALDHVRALASFMVVAWHFLAATKVPYLFVPIFPLAVFDQGFTGVSLFMTLSGYLFAKLLFGKSINYRAFIWNRIIRLLPLLAVVILIVGLQKACDGEDLQSYAFSILKGIFLFGPLPNGGWSIIVEFHFYLILPVLLWMFRRNGFIVFPIVLVAIVLRFGVLEWKGSIQGYAYGTILGRIDQFTLGMIAYQFRHLIAGRHLLAGIASIGFMLFFWQFDAMGGFYEPVFPSSSVLWVFMTPIEGAAYALLIAWYDNSFRHSDSLPSRIVGRMGDYSYAVYLLHSFFIAGAVVVLPELTNFYAALAWSVVFYAFMMLPGYLSWRFIESPCLKYRKRYVVDSKQVEPASRRTVK